MSSATKTRGGVEADEWDAEDVIQDMPVPVGISGDEQLPAEAPAVRTPVDPRIPSQESHPAVIRTRTRFAQLADQWRATRRDLAAAANDANLELQDVRVADLEEIASRMTLDGKDTASIDATQKLVKDENRVTAALKLAAGEIAAALQLAQRDIGPKAIDDILAPLHRAEAMAWVQIVKARLAKDAAIHQLGMAGYGFGSFAPLFPPDRGYPADRMSVIAELGRLIATGTLTRDEAAASGMM